MLHNKNKRLLNDLCELMLYGLIDRPAPEEAK